MSRRSHPARDQSPKRGLARPALPRGPAFWIAAVIAFLGFASNTAASPLYRVYQAQFRFSAGTLTLLFTVYIVVLLATLLFLGSLSDYVGRRRVILAGLAAGALACGLFALAHGIGLLYAARALQGVAVGLCTGAASAALLDLRPGSRTAPLVSSAAPTAGQGLGAIGASALAQFAPAPTHLVWWLLIGAFIISIPAVLAMPEPGATRPGVLSSLRPRVSVPREARGAFIVALPCLAGVWALGGFYLSLGPSLAAQLVKSDQLLWGGALIFLLTGLGAIVSAPLAKRDPSGVMLGGCAALIAGALVTFAAIKTSTMSLLFIGTAIAGTGFGPAFMGAYKMVVASAPSASRAGLITAIYIVSYVATGIPAVIAGFATSRYGIHATALVYSVVVAALVAGAIILLIRQMAAAGTAEPRGHVPDEGA